MGTLVQNTDKRSCPLRSGELQKLQDEAESELTAARKAAQALIMAAKDATQAEQNKVLAEAKAVRPPPPPPHHMHTHPPTHPTHTHPHTTSTRTLENHNNVHLNFQGGGITTYISTPCGMLDLWLQGAEAAGSVVW